MARDHKNYAYLTIALERDGPTYQALLKDAQEVGTKQLPTVAAIALKHYYAGAQHQKSAVPGSTLPGKERLEERSVQPAEKEPTVLVKNASMADANADAAIDEW